MNTLTRIKNREYINMKEYPDIDDIPSVCTCGNETWDNMKFCGKCGTKFPEIDKMAIFNRLLLEYTSERKRIQNLFKTHLEEEFGLQEYKKKDLLYDIAFQPSHPDDDDDEEDSLRATYNAYKELVELVLD